MELIVQVRTLEALDAALEAGVGGVARRLPRRPQPPWWLEAEGWRAAAGRRGVNFYLIWDWLAPEKDLPGAEQILAAISRINPNALLIRDMGLLREARRRCPGLKLHAARNWGCHNSPGLHLAEALGFSRVVVDSALGLKNLALMRRQARVPLVVALPNRCPGLASLCLLEEFLGIDCNACLGIFAQGEELPGILPAALEALSGLSQLDVEAIQVGGEFTDGESLHLVVELYQRVWRASPGERPQVLAAAREALAAFGHRLKEMAGEKGQVSRKKLPVRSGVRKEGKPSPSSPRLFQGHSRLWLEARDYEEAEALARGWRGPLLIQVNRENYATFLPKHRRWEGRRLIWRLPPMIPEAELSFYLKALETLRQGGYGRFVAGDWGGVALVRRLGGEVYGDQTLGVRNSWALEMARDLGVTRVCLPPGEGPGDWQELLSHVPPGSFWGYLYHFPALAVGPRPGTAVPRQGQGPSGEKLRWVEEGELALLCRELPENLVPLAGWLQERKVAPLVAALARSDLTRGQVPAWVSFPRQERRGPPRA